MNFSRLSIARRLSIFQAAVILIVLCAFGFTLSSIVNRRMQARMEDELHQQVSMLVGMISSYNSALAENAETDVLVFLDGFPGAFNLKPAAGAAPQLYSGSLDLSRNSLQVDHFHSVTGMEASVFVRTGETFVRIATSMRKPTGERLLGTVVDNAHPACQPLLGGQRYSGKAHVGEREFITAYMPLKDASGRVIGALAVGKDFTESLKTLTRQILQIKIGKTGYIYAMDARPGSEQGVMRIHPTMLGKNLIHSKDASGFEFLRDMVERKQGASRYMWINKERGETSPREKIAVFAYSSEWNWIIAAGSYVDELNAEGRMLRNAILVAAVLVVLLLVVLQSTMAHKWISLPLKRAVALTETLAQGDFRQIGREADRQQSSENEIGQLENGIFRMARSLDTVLKQIHAAADRVAESCHQITEGSSNSTANATRQSEKTDQVARAIEQVSSSVSEVSQNSTQAAHAAHLTVETAQRGGEVVQETLNAMQSIANSTGTVSARIEALGESSNRIGAIASVISEIASQTNLLALNAAIEAARAGEQGRGFAVVAGEVRALAERTGKATEEISQMISAIQREAAEAVQAMREESGKVSLGVSKTNDCGMALEQIIEVARQVGGMVTSIASAAEQQSGATEEVNRHVHDIAHMASQSSEFARQTSTSSASLAELAESLQATVRRFQLSGE